MSSFCLPLLLAIAVAVATAYKRLVFSIWFTIWKNSLDMTLSSYTGWNIFKWNWRKLADKQEEWLIENENDFCSTHLTFRTFLSLFYLYMFKMLHTFHKSIACIMEEERKKNQSYVDTILASWFHVHTCFVYTMYIRIVVAI